jgi:hypothetical protein
MLLVAFAYRELNKVMPDCGTSFTWTVKAFGPCLGWMCGWGVWSSRRSSSCRTWRASPPPPSGSVND